MTIDLHLADLGRGIPREALLEEGHLHVALGTTYATRLAQVGWTAARTQALLAARGRDHAGR